MRYSIKAFTPFFMVVGLLLTAFFLLPSSMAVADTSLSMPTVKVDIDHDGDCEGDCAAIAGGQTITGTIDGANYRIRVPANWDNGTLVVYAHGYRDKADHAGETDDTSAEAAPRDADDVSMEDALLASGYAVAGSAYRDNGWAVQEGISDTLALTNHFSDTVGAADKTILLGYSMGSVVTFKSIELYPDVYDGAIPACAVGAGATKAWDSAMAMALAYDVAFGWRSEWGSVADVNDNLDFETQVAPILVPQALDPANKGKFEFMRLVGGLPAEEFYDPNGANWLLTDMFFFTEARAELERRAGGPATQNIDHTYSLTAEHKAYLQTLNVDGDALLAQMNERTNIEADPSARAYIEQYADYTGNIQRPVITLHTDKDGLVPVANESVYSDTVAAANRSDLLYQVYTESVGHCTFSAEQLLETVSAMNTWLSTGTAPTAADFTAEGFLNDFEPPAWPISIPSHQTMMGTIDGANYRIRVPTNWDNGTLVVYAHGYTDKADHAGEIDNTRADAAPGGVPMEDALLRIGYAVAGSAYRDNGWAVQEGISDTLALTNHFSDTFGAPDKTILWGFSMGSVVTFKSIELYPDVYDGAIPACAVGAGATKAWDSALAMALAYDVAFDWPEAWGTVADVRDDLDFESDVYPVLLDQAQNQANLGKFEFMRLVGGLPAEQFYDGANWLFTDMFFFTEARAELERRAGGPATQNLNHTYSLTDQQKADLQTLNVDADALLAQMNERTNISADASARAYLEQYADYTGNIQRPVITLHTRHDGLVPVANESVYRDTVAAAGQSDLLYQVYTESVGHCTFAPEQLIATLTAMNKWLTPPADASSRGPTPPGPAPTAADFPAAVGFIPDFEPPVWPIAIEADPTNVSLAEFSGQAPSRTGWLALLPMLMASAGLLYLRRRKA